MRNLGGPGRWAPVVGLVLGSLLAAGGAQAEPAAQWNDAYVTIHWEDFCLVKDWSCSEADIVHAADASMSMIYQMNNFTNNTGAPLKIYCTFQSQHSSVKDCGEFVYPPGWNGAGFGIGIQRVNPENRIGNWTISWRIGSYHGEVIHQRTFWMNSTNCPIRIEIPPLIDIFVAGADWDGQNALNASLFFGLPLLVLARAPLGRLRRRED